MSHPAPNHPPLQILHLEDKADDALLVRDQLAADGLAAEVRHVTGRQEFERALQEGKWDLVLSDYHLPDFNGLDALRRVRGLSASLPFILMSGTIGELAAIESLKAGATDYVLKQNRDRLPSAVRRALAEAAERSRRELAEQDLRSSEKLFHSVWEKSVDGMRLTDEQGTIIAVNDAFCRLVGLARGQLEGKSFGVIYSPTLDWETMLSKHRALFRAGAEPDQKEAGYVLHDGRSVVFEITNSPVETGGKPHLLLSLFRDVTAQKQLEEQFRQAQKMEAVGQLAGGIAHDFNNILTIILGHASLLLTGKLTPQALVSARQIKQASERAAGLTRQLLAFGRKQIFNPRPIDLNPVVGKIAELLPRLLGEDIAFQFQGSPEPATIEADPGMMEQVLMNLAVNSRDAMPRGGRLTIRIEVCEVDAGHAGRQVEAQPGPYVCLSHTDSGGGIPPENLPRIFEPFFTTKEPGKGTGLGLATVFGIVKQHRGWVEVESELGQGTTFRIYFPVTTAPPTDLHQFDTQFRSRGGDETILVVEDERDLREIITRTLNRHGYRVFQAVDGPNALQIWAEYRHDIALLFTDVIMPGGYNGRELAEKFWADKPGLKVIFSSGYGADVLGRDFKLDPDYNFLQKPYPPQAIVRLVRNCLDGKTTDPRAA